MSETTVKRDQRWLEERIQTALEQDEFTIAPTWQGVICVATSNARTRKGQCEWLRRTLKISFADDAYRRLLQRMKFGITKDGL